MRLLILPPNYADGCEKRISTQEEEKESTLCSQIQDVPQHRAVD